MKQGLCFFTPPSEKSYLWLLRNTQHVEVGERRLPGDLWASHSPFLYPDHMDLVVFPEALSLVTSREQARCMRPGAMQMEIFGRKTLAAYKFYTESPTP